jgi:hypothetical protein
MRSHDAAPYRLRLRSALRCTVALLPCWHCLADLGGELHHYRARKGPAAEAGWAAGGRVGGFLPDVPIATSRADCSLMYRAGLAWVRRGARYRAQNQSLAPCSSCAEGRARKKADPGKIWRDRDIQNFTQATLSKRSL